MLTVVEAGTEKSITPQQPVELSLGANDIVAYAIEDYRLSGNEVCFEIRAYLREDKISLESRRPFCARTIDRGWWSMR
ncbi:MAG TPA: hypothetical protein VJQ55_06725 [Candidatus Binatia bacterium]|nr:hypothetical protein [Candidatus Binatia bacterium]